MKEIKTIVLEVQDMKQKNKPEVKDQQGPKQFDNFVNKQQKNNFNKKGE